MEFLPPPRRRLCYWIGETEDLLHLPFDIEIVEEVRLREAQLVAGQQHRAQRARVVENDSGQTMITIWPLLAIPKTEAGGLGRLSREHRIQHLQAEAIGIFGV